MVYKIDKLRWLNRVSDDFDGETITVKLMKGTVPTTQEGYDMAPTTRDTDMLASFSVALDGSGNNQNTVAFSPSATGTVTWAKIIFGNYVITTDQIGVVNTTGKLMWLSSLSLTASVPAYLQALHISMTGV